MQIASLSPIAVHAEFLHAMEAMQESQLLVKGSECTHASLSHMMQASSLFLQFVMRVQGSMIFGITNYDMYVDCKLSCYANAVQRHSASMHPTFLTFFYFYKLR